MSDTLPKKHLVARIYSKKLGGHVHVRVFAAMVYDDMADKDDQMTLGCAGTLTFREEEWPTVAARLLQGGFQLYEDRSDAAFHGALVVLIPTPKRGEPN